MSAAKLQRNLDTAVKVASVLITVPATWGVADLAFAAVSSLVVRRVLQVAAVVAVDGVWLLSWYGLDLRRRDKPEEKLYNALVVAAMYGSTLVIALKHGEGAAGLVFRLAIGLAVGRSVWGALAHSWRQFVAGLRESLPEAGGYERRARRRVKRAAIDARREVATQRIETRKAAQLVALRRLGGRMQSLAQTQALAVVRGALDGGGNWSDGLGVQVSDRGWSATCVDCGRVLGDSYSSELGARNALNAHRCPAPLLLPVLAYGNGRHRQASLGQAHS